MLATLAELIQMVRSVGAGEDAAVPSNGGQPAVPALLARLLGGPVANECQANEQLRPAQVGPPSSGRVQGGGQVIGLGHEVTRSGRRHTKV